MQSLKYILIAIAASIPLGKYVTKSIINNSSFPNKVFSLKCYHCGQVTPDRCEKLLNVPTRVRTDDKYYYN